MPQRQVTNQGQKAIYQEANTNKNFDSHSGSVQNKKPSAKTEENVINKKHILSDSDSLSSSEDSGMKSKIIKNYKQLISCVLIL